MRIRSILTFVLAVSLPLVLWAALPLVSGADDHGRVNRLQRKIDAAQGRLNGVNGRAHVLTSDISAYTRRIDTLQGGITRLQRRQNTIQADLDAKQRELAGTQTKLRDVRGRLVRLRARLNHARAVLAQRLVQIYKSDAPDLVSIVLNAHGFADLLESSAFLERIGRQDRQIIVAVRDAKAQATTAEQTLSDLERGQQEIAGAIRDRRNVVAKVKLDLVSKREDVDRARAGKRDLLRRVKASASDLHEHIDYLQSEQAKIERRIRAAQQRSAGTLPAGPIRAGGMFIWPVNGPITSPFCETRSWERCHPGIDIGVPSGTPIRAAGSGTVSIAGPVSGYGNYTCVQHAGPLSTCYAHQSQFLVSVGQHVAQGQVIGISGCTGLCFGPHLHFEVRVNGSVVNPLNYLG